MSYAELFDFSWILQLDATTLAIIGLAVGFGVCLQVMQCVEPCLREYEVNRRKKEQKQEESEACGDFLVNVELCVPRPEVRDCVCVKERRYIKPTCCADVLMRADHLALLILLVVSLMCGSYLVFVQARRSMRRLRGCEEAGL